MNSSPRIRLERVDFDEPDAISLREAMVAEVSAVYGSNRDYSNDDDGLGIDPQSVVLTLVGYDGEAPVAQAVLRRLGDDLEIKRMYVVPESRGAGASRAMLVELEAEARALSAARVILHTGSRQVAAIRAYERHGYTPIEIYEPYVGMPESLCFEKLL